MALIDLEQAFEFISLANPEAAKQIVQQILIAIERLEAFPETGRMGRVKGTRELIISSLSYIIVYRIKGSSVEIWSILHSSRKWL